jgi:hypothetical protein
MVDLQAGPVVALPAPLPAGPKASVSGLLA